MTDEKQTKKKQADELVDLAERSFTFMLAATGEPFAVRKDGPNLAIMLRGGNGGNRSLRAELSRSYRDEHGTVPTGSALADAMLAIEAIAYDSPDVPLSLRVAEHDGKCVLDLGRTDGTVVVIEPHSWSIKPSPVTFRRTQLTNEIPTPDRTGDQNLPELYDLMNIGKDSFDVLVGWLVASLIEHIPHPIVYLSGEQGTGKTSAARTVRSVLDPSPAPVQAPPGSLNDWATSASGSWITAIDNLSTIRPWLQDALCRAATGEGLVRRQLFSDSDLAVLTFRRCIIMTAIDAGALRGDLADRLVAIELERIDPGERRTDDELAERFAEAAPRILGGLLNLTAAVLGELPHVELDELPRMADFARVLKAVDSIRGTDSLGTYLGQGDDLAVDVVESDPVASAVFALATDEGSWCGTATHLLARITPEHIPKDWPGSASALSAQLTRCAPTLLRLGVKVTKPHRGAQSRSITIELVDQSYGVGKTPSSPSSPSHPLQSLASSDDGDSDGDDRDDGDAVTNDGTLRTPSRRDPNSRNGSDGDDGDDGDFATPTFRLDITPPNPSPKTTVQQPEQHSEQPANAPGNDSHTSNSRRIVTRRKRKKWGPILEAGADFVNTSPLPVTLRQLFYHLGTIGLLDNDPNDYAYLSKKTAEARREGTFPDLTDGTRTITQLSSWNSPSHLLSHYSQSFAYDRTTGQHEQTWLILEKSTLAATAQQITEPYGVPFVALRGYGSQTIKQKITDRIVADGRPCRVVYVGDFDPSGEDLERDVRNRIDTTLITSWERVAVTPDQIDEYDLPVNPGKPGDSRAKQFEERNGALVQVEVEALDPTVLAGLIDDAVARYLDLDHVAEIRAQEFDVREMLAETATNWETP